MRARTALLALATLCSAALPAEAAPTLRPSVTVSSDLVRLGDLVDGAGDAASQPVFCSPDLGTTGTVQASRVAQAARDNGIVDLDTGGVAEVSVTRASRTVGLDEAQHAITSAILRQANLPEDATLLFAFDPGARSAHIEPSLVAALQVTQVNWNALTGRFDATLGVEGSTILARSPLRLGGTAQQTVPVPVFTRDVKPGDILRASDIDIQRLPRSPATDGAVSSPQVAIGMGLRRLVRSGQTVASADLIRPNLVERNDGVTLVYEVPGIVLTVRAKALESGAMGDTVSVLNAQSNRIVPASVIGPGRVSVATPAHLALN